MDIPKLVVIPLVTVGVTQILKFSIQAVRGEIRWGIFQEYGGMPSAHTAFVLSLDTVVALHDGIMSTAFAVAVVFSLLIIRDAIGLRQFIGLHGRILNMLIRELPPREERKFPDHLVEQLGHTPLQAFVGGVIGLVFGYFLYLWIPATW